MSKDAPNAEKAANPDRGTRPEVSWLCIQPFSMSLSNVSEESTLLQEHHCLQGVANAGEKGSGEEVIKEGGASKQSVAAADLVADASLAPANMRSPHM